MFVAVLLLLARNRLQGVQETCLPLFGRNGFLHSSLRTPSCGGGCHCVDAYAVFVVLCELVGSMRGRPVNTWPPVLFSMSTPPDHLPFALQRLLLPPPSYAAGLVLGLG